MKIAIFVILLISCCVVGALIFATSRTIASHYRSVLSPNQTADVSELKRLLSRTELEKVAPAVPAPESLREENTSGSQASQPLTGYAAQVAKPEFRQWVDKSSLFDFVRQFRNVNPLQVKSGSVPEYGPAERLQLLLAPRGAALTAAQEASVNIKPLNALRNDLTNDQSSAMDLLIAERTAAEKYAALKKSP